MKNSFAGKTIIIGVTASIAAYKTLLIIKELKKSGASVFVICTLHALKLIDPSEFEAASGNPVATSLFNEELDYKAYLKNNKQIEHISLADSADVFVICPATANILAKTAHGHADDVLTSTILATNAPVLFCPAMNVKMWKNAATQENVRILKKRGHELVDPEYGELACGYTGVGRLANPNTIIERVTLLLNNSDQFHGKKVIVTAGATQESIDKVRVITNIASGKMGAALADAFYRRGADVVFIHGLNSKLPERFMKEVGVASADEMLAAFKQTIKDADIVIHSAAVSDFAPTSVVDGKIKSNQKVQLELTPKTKILEQLKKLNPKAFIIGFKAEVGLSEAQLIESAFTLLKKSHADLIIANDISQSDRGFGADANEVFIVNGKKKATKIPLASKQIVAEKIIEYIFTL